MKGIMKKVTAIFMALVMVLSCVVVNGTTVNAEGEYTVNPDEYGIEYLLSNYQVYLQNNLDTTSQGHQVGSLVIGGNANLVNSFGDASIAPSYLNYIQAFCSTNPFYTDVFSQEEYQGCENAKVYYRDCAEGVILHDSPKSFIKVDSYIDITNAFTSIQEQSDAKASAGQSVTVENDYIVLDMSVEGENHIYTITEEQLVSAKAIRLKGTDGKSDVFRSEENPLVISFTGCADKEVSLTFDNEGVVGEYSISIQMDQNEDPSEDEYAPLINDLAFKFWEDSQQGGQVNPVGTKVIWNFPDVTETIHCRYLAGHLVAPKAHISMTGGNFEGGIIAKSAYLDAEGHFYPYYKIGTATADVQAKPVLSGKDFIIALDQVASATDSTVLDLSEAKYHESINATGDSNGVKVDNLEDLRKMTEPGEVVMILSDATGSNPKATSIQVIATVVATEADNHNGLQLGASNFELSIAQAQAILNNTPSWLAVQEMVKTLANVVGVRNGEELDITNIFAETHNIKAEKGTFPVTFRINDVFVTVQATVKDDGPTDGVTDPTDIPGVNLTANNFTVDGGSATLTEESFIVKAEVVAKNNDGSSRHDIKVDAQDLAALNDKIKNAIDGDYQVDVTSGGVTTTVTVTVISGYPYISADDFIIQVEEAKTADADKVKDLSNAEQIPEPGEPGDSNKVDVKNLNDLNNQNEAGIVEVVLTDNTTNEEKAVDRTVVATVVDEKKADIVDGVEVVIGANNFNISMVQAQAIVNSAPSKAATEAMVKVLANAVATDDGDTVKSEDIAVDTSAIQAVDGTYDVTFTYKGQSVTVKATVKDDGPTDKATDPTDVPNINLTANDFAVEAKSPALTEDTFKSAANVEANYNTGASIPTANIDVDDADLATLNQKIAEGVPGEYEVDVTTGDVTTTVTVTVTEKYPKVDANDFIISVEDAKDVDADDIKYLSDTKRYESPSDETSGTDKGTENVIVPSGEVDELNGITEPGSVEITIEDENADPADDQTVKATVVDETKTSQDGKIVIGANNYSISMAQAEAIVEALANANAKPNKAATDLMNKILANAVATDDGKAVDRDDIVVDASDVEAEAGTYNVTFTYKGESVTVKATVKDAGSTDRYDDPTRVPGVNLTANDFTVVGGSPELTPQDFIKSADVVAKNNDGSRRQDIVVDADDLAALNKQITDVVAGAYKVDVMSGGVTTTVTVTVTKPETYPKLDANDFIIDVDDLKDITPEDVKDLSDTNRYTTPEEEKDGSDNGSDQVIVPDITDLTGRDEPGSVDLTLKDGNQDPAEDKPVTAIVVDETTTSKDGKIVIGANNFNVTMEQAEAIEKNPTSDAVLTMVKTLANAVATDEGEKVAQKDIAIKDVTVIKAENGTYDVTFIYGGESVTVKATVKDAGAGDGSSDPTKVPDVNLTGNDFAVEAGSDPLTEDAFKDVPNADVEANYNDGSSVPEDKVKVNPEDLEKLNDAIKNGETGPVDVEVVVDDKTTVITVTITDEKTVDNGNKETVAANNFEIKLSEYDTVVDSKDELVKRAEAFAYDTDTRADVEIAKATVKDPKKEAGTYDVTFATEKGSAVTVTMTVVADDSNITAKDFSVEAGSDPLTPDEFVKKAEVVAKKSDGTPITSVTVDPTDLATLNKAIEEGKEGPQTVKVIADGKTATVTVTVTKGDDIKGQDKIYELSNPKDVPQTLAQGRTVKNVNVDGKDIPSSAYEVSGNEMKIKSSVFKDKKEGVYPVVITYKDGSKHTFNVTVVPYNKETVVTKVPIFHMQKDLGLGKKFKINLVGMTKYSIKKFKTSNKRIATVDKNGVIKGKKIGKCKITATIIQNGSYYTVKIDLHVKKSMKMYNLKKKALQKKEGNLPEFNVYKRVVKGKKTKMKFTNIAKNAKITYTSSNKKVATVSKKGVIKGKKKGFTVVTDKIEQSGHTYYTKLIVRVDDGTKNRDLKKYLK